MAQSWIEYIPWVYASIQGVITLIISIVGAKYVRYEVLSQKKRMEQQQELQIAVNEEEKSQTPEDAKVKKHSKAKHVEEGRALFQRQADGGPQQPSGELDQYEVN